MPLDPQVKALLGMTKGMLSFSELSPAAARKQSSEMGRCAAASRPTSRTSRIARFPDPRARFRFASIRPQATVRFRCWSIITAADL